MVAVLGLFFLAPISAEYLLGYDDIIGRPWELVFGLLIFGPLYGAPALLIRETARRAGRGWPTILTLSFAAGLIQAGLIDQSLFNPDYPRHPVLGRVLRGLPRYLPGLGFSAYMLLGFIGGHMIQSFGAPIAIVESLSPDLSRLPWLRWPGLVIMALLYLAAASFVLADQAKTEGFVASGPQLVGSAIVVVGLVIAAFAVPRRDRSRTRPSAIAAGGGTRRPRLPRHQGPDAHQLARRRRCISRCWWAWASWCGAGRLDPAGALTTCSPWPPPVTGERGDGVLDRAVGGPPTGGEVRGECGAGHRGDPAPRGGCSIPPMATGQSARNDQRYGDIQIQVRLHLDHDPGRGWRVRHRR